MPETPVRLAAALPKSLDANGLRHEVAKILAEPSDAVVCVVVLHTKDITRDIVHGNTVPTMFVHRIEAITDPDDLQHVGNFAHRAYSKRTGQDPLPYDDYTAHEFIEALAITAEVSADD